MASGFAAWVRDQIVARGYESPEEAARALGVYPSQMRQWTRISRSPTPQVLRRVAALFDAPVQEVLIAAGFMTEEENLPLSPTRKSLQQLSNKQILDEIRRRTMSLTEDLIEGAADSCAGGRSSPFAGWPAHSVRQLHLGGPRTPSRQGERARGILLLEYGAEPRLAVAHGT